MFPFKPKPTKSRSSIRVKYATLYAILTDIEALHERVHELAYYQFERPLPSNGMGIGLGISPHPPAYPYGPASPSPSPSSMPPWHSPRSTPMQDHPPLYTHTYSSAIASPPPSPPPRYGSMRKARRSRSIASPALVCRLRGGSGASGAHGTPKITRTAPERRGRRDGGKKGGARKRVRGNRVVQEEETESGSGSEESGEDEDEEMQDAQGDGDRRGGRGGVRGFAI